MQQSAELAESVSRLTTLPAELLGQILEHLVPEPPEVGETRPVGYDKLLPGEPWFDFTRSRRALRSLCLTSHGLRNLSQPLLYRRIAILDEEGMLLLFRTLSERPTFGNLTRYLSCHLTLTSEAVILETRRVLGRVLRTFQTDMDALGQENRRVRKAMMALLAAFPRLKTREGDFDEMPQMLLYYVLTFMQALDTLLLQIPICDDDPEYVALFDRLSHGDPWTGTRLGGGVASAASGDGEAGQGQPLQNVRTLLLQGDPELLLYFESDDCRCETPETWGVQARRYWPLFEAIPNLTTLEVSEDDGFWNNVRRRRTNGSRPPYLSGIKHIYLHNSITFPNDLHIILNNAPSLQTLYMTPRRDNHDFIPPPEVFEVEAHPQAFDAALLKRRAKLRHLDVAWFDLRAYLDLLGPEGRLSSLPQLTRLEKLCIQLATLYGTDSANLSIPLVDLLPHSLVELTLEEWWWEDSDILATMEIWTRADQARLYGSKGEYRAKALGVLSRFAMECPERMPKLRKVTFLTKIPWAWKMDGYVSMEAHFEETRDLFRSRGIEFLADEV